MPITRNTDPGCDSSSSCDDRFAEIQSAILAARRSTDLRAALRLTARAVRQLCDHHPASPDKVDAAWFSQWQTTMHALGDLLDQSLLPASEQVGDIARERERLTDLVHRDPLTGLGNRRALQQHFADLVACRASTPHVVAMIDLDGFKAVNDVHSHARGDAVLIAIAETLCASLRTGHSGRDTVTRYGGDEFVAVLATPLPDAVAALQRATHAVAALPTARAHGVTLSIGVASLGPDDNPAEVLLAADNAMYAAKRVGGNAVRSALGAR